MPNKTEGHKTEGQVFPCHIKHKKRGVSLLPAPDWCASENTTGCYMTGVNSPASTAIILDRGLTGLLVNQGLAPVVCDHSSSKHHVFDSVELNIHC